MNDLLTLDDLARLLVIKHNITREDADLLLQNFLNVIEKGLLTDRYVRIKGLGTFKLIVENADNGASYNRIVFVPDVSLKTAVNKPFAHFESVVLNDDVRFDDIDELELTDSAAAENETEEEDNAVTLDNRDTEVDNIENAGEAGQSSIQESTAEDGIAIVDDETVETDGFKAPEEEISETEASWEQQATDGSEISEIGDTEGNGNSKANSGVVPVYKAEPAFQNSKRHNIPWCLMILVLFIGLALGGIISWQIFGNRMRELLPTENIPISNVAENNEENNPATETLIAPEDSIVATSAADNVLDMDEDKIVDKASIDSILQVAGNEKEEKVVIGDFYSEKLTYRITGTIKSHKIAKGNTLAKIAYKYYRNKKMWPYIVMHNKDIIKDPNNVPIGTVINIPILEAVE